MRPVNRPNGAYYGIARQADIFDNASMQNCHRLDKNIVKCLSLCIDHQIREISYMIREIDPTPLPALPMTYDSAADTNSFVLQAVSPEDVSMDGASIAAAINAAAKKDDAAVYLAVKSLAKHVKNRFAANIINSAFYTNLQLYKGHIPLSRNLKTVGGLVRRILENHKIDPAVDYDRCHAAFDGVIQNITKNSSIINLYVRYLIIRRNLAYNFIKDNFFHFPALIVEDIPYAISAMQDVREIVRASKTQKLHAFATQEKPIPICTVEKLDISNQYVVGYRSAYYDLDKIGNYINILYEKLDEISNSTPSEYKSSTTELLSKFGSYCTYCEAGIVSEVNVEHILPKGVAVQDNYGIYQGFSSLAKSWLNFLPSCGRCNSTKNAKPTKFEITKAAIDAEVEFTKDTGFRLTALTTVLGRKEVGGDPKITDREYARLYLDQYLFPLEPRSYQDVGFQLVDVTTGTASQYALNALRDQVQWTGAQTDQNKKAVTVTIPGGLPTERDFRVLIDDTGTGAFLPSIQVAKRNLEKINNMVGLCGLNAEPTFTDGRGIERTTTWFAALSAVGDLDRLFEQQLASAAPEQWLVIYESWRNGVIAHMKSQGFLSIWLKIFAQFQVPNVLYNATGCPAFPAVPVAGKPFLPMIGGGASSGVNAQPPARGAVIKNLAQDIAQTILQTGRGVAVAAAAAAATVLGTKNPIEVNLAASWSTADPRLIFVAEEEARKAGSAYSSGFPNTDWSMVP